MNKIIVASIALLTSGCVVHAHPHPPPTPPAVHRPAPPVAHHAPNPKPIKVKAWVWIKGHQTRYGYAHGYWDLRTVPRHMVNRHPHTHVRQVKGRGRPAPPPRRYR